MKNMNESMIAKWGCLMAVAMTLVSSALFGASKEDVNVTSISIPNVIGVEQLTSDREYTPLAVCYGATAVSANRPVNEVRHVTNLVFTANLQENDQLFVFDHDRKGYVTYRLTADKAWEPETVFDPLLKSKDMTPNTNQAQPWGYGFWLRRPGIDKRADKRIFLAGQVSIDSVSVSIEDSTASTFGKTLIGNPLGAPWDLNDTKIIDWSTVAKENDHIQLNDASATMYYWKKLTKSPEKWGWKRVSGKGDGVIPAGAAFWYVRAKPTAAEVKAAAVPAPITISFRTGL